MFRAMVRSVAVTARMARTAPGHGRGGGETAHGLAGVLVDDAARILKGEQHVAHERAGARQHLHHTRTLAGVEFALLAVLKLL